MTLPTPQETESRQLQADISALQEMQDLTEFSYQTSALQRAIKILPSLPSLRQKAEAWDEHQKKIRQYKVVSENDQEHWLTDAWGPFLLTAHKLTPPTQ